MKPDKVLCYSYSLFFGLNIAQIPEWKSCGYVTHA